MTTTVHPPAGAFVAGPTVPGASPLPQVNLLPPEIRAGRQLKNVKAWLGVAVLITALVAGVLFLWATFMLRTAEAELAATQDQNTALVAEQQQYAEVPLVLNELAAVEEARLFGMSTEVVWTPYLQAVAASAPEGVSLDQLAFTGATPTDAAPDSTNPLAAAHVGAITFTARSLNLPDTATWIDNLAAVPGFSDPWFGSAQVSDEDGIVYYSVTGTVNVNEQAYAERFVVVEEEG